MQMLFTLNLIWPKDKNSNILNKPSLRSAFPLVQESTFYYQETAQPAKSVY